MFPMHRNFEPESALISASSNSALIEKYLRNTCLEQDAVPNISPGLAEARVHFFSNSTSIFMGFGQKTLISCLI